MITPTLPSAEAADLLARFARLPAWPLEEQLRLSPGTLADYTALAPWHYRAGRPATIARILRLAWPQDPHAAPAAVLVESLPTLACHRRDQALGGRYTACPEARTRARLLYAELRCISRVIVHPQWRGLGLAVRLVRHALFTATTPYTEAFARMGWLHPFFALAGMTAYPPRDPPAARSSGRRPRPAPIYYLHDNTGSHHETPARI